MDEEPGVRTPSARVWWLLAVVSLAQLMIALDATVMNVALPPVQADLRFSDTGRQWIITAYTLTFGGLLLLGGRVSDRLGSRQALVIGAHGFAGSSALAGAAPDFAVLAAGRAAQGVFAALLAPTALGLVGTIFTAARDRTRALRCSVPWRGPGVPWVY